MGNFDAEKTIVVPDSGGTGNNFLAGMLASACQSKGLDANAVMALCGNRNGSFGNGWDGIIALIVIAAIFGGNGNGLFGNNNNSTERQMLMDAIQHNGVDISQLASTLNCSVGQVQAAIQQVASQVCNVGNQVGMTGQQIINSIQQGNMALTQQICNCCCDIKTGIKDQTIALQGELNSVNRSVERGFADVGYATRDQTCNIEKAIQASTESILAGQRAAEMREMQREIAERDRRIAEQAVIINNAQKKCIEAQRSSWNLSKMKFLSQKSLMNATVVAVMAVAQAVTAMKMMTTMRTTMSAEVYLVLVDMVVVDTVEDAATNN